MNLRTELNLTPSSWKLEMKDRVVTLGSCFAASIGTQLADHKLPVVVNPFGTTYHPLAIDRLINCALAGELPASPGYVCRNQTWFHHDFHSSFFADTEKQLAQRLESQLRMVREALQNANVLMLTYGTGYQYELVDNGRPVANCHRMPATSFRRRLVSVEEIVLSARGTLSKLLDMNPRLHVILTVSPVRHVRDSLPLNSVSKAVLRLACHLLQEKESAVDYFPAYELLLDDLRDYRFYKDDLIHPTTLAEEYVWKKFLEAYASPTTLRFIEVWQSIQPALRHRAFNARGKEHQEFLRSTIQRLHSIRNDVDVENEIQELESKVVGQPVE